MIVKLVLITVISLFVTESHATDKCLQWFKNASLNRGADCNLKCMTLSVDMGTFDCRSQCDSLCKSPPDQKNFPLNYPKGITKGDRAMITKRPMESIKVFREKQVADDLTLKVFKQQGRNDESDAFRHFVWAALITNELGLDIANEFLTAHEDEDGQPQLEKEMDIFNNNLGSDFVVNRKNKKIPLELDEVENAAFNKLRSNQLKILKSNQKKIPNGYYSK